MDEWDLQSWNLPCLHLQHFTPTLTGEAVPPATGYWLLRKSITTILLFSSLESIASSATFPCLFFLLIPQHWRAGRAPRLQGASSAWVVMHAGDWNNKSHQFKIPVNCGRSRAVCCVGVLSDKTHIPIQTKCPPFSCGPLHRILLLPDSLSLFCLCLSQ